MNKKQLLIYGLSVFCFEQEKFNDWLKTKNKLLENKTPKELLKTSEGIQQVKTLLDNIEYGNFT